MIVLFKVSYDVLYIMFVMERFSVYYDLCVIKGIFLFYVFKVIIFVDNISYFISWIKCVELKLKWCKNL